MNDFNIINDNVVKAKQKHIISFIIQCRVMKYKAINNPLIKKELISKKLRSKK
jgi:hypothetical protein